MVRYGVHAVDTSLTHPTHIRSQYNENLATLELPSDLQDLSPVTTVTLDTREAEKVAKVINRVKTGGEGSDIAKRHLTPVTPNIQG
ncbi:MAG: hypothetical protein PSV17_00015 [Methylotenera sp.]|uniref:hypothetical protein n=1 Tax=Methylotenera sp. TaxID=2051956 RepID=UPI002486CFAD|nr:hypothetical protein [Methylotenera sp.]MDI1307799.1 hypothetical protein [Methylotenera sp.]